jgi:hypothetical protein
MEATSVFFAVRSGRGILGGVLIHSLTVSIEEVGEIVNENGAERGSWSSRMEPTELVVVELRFSVVIIG